MSLNNHFSLKRFSLLLKQDLLINRTKYVLSILGLGLITYLIMYFFLNSTKGIRISYDLYIRSYYIGFFIFYMMAVGVIVGTAFPDLSDKIKTSNFLLAPASILEKLLVQFVIRIGILIPVSLAIFWIALRLAKASLVSDFEKEFDISKIPYFKFSMLITNTYDDHLMDTWQIYFIIFGLFSYLIYLFAGATFFRRFALVKTVIISGILFVFCGFFMSLLSHIFYPVETNDFQIQLKSFQIAKQFNSIQFSLLLLSLFSWVFFLFFTYFKLKEKEA